MKKQKSRFGFGVLLLCGCLLLWGCGIEEKSDKKVKELEYSIVSEKELPEEVKQAIAEKKEDEMKITYESDKDLYIIRGYGKQKTGGYSIQVKKFYQAKNAVYLETELVGPGETDVKKKANSYPYIVIKTEKTEDVVVFD